MRRGGGAAETDRQTDRGRGTETEGERENKFSTTALCTSPHHCCVMKALSLPGLLWQIIVDTHKHTVTFR